MSAANEPAPTVGMFARVYQQAADPSDMRWMLLAWMLTFSGGEEMTCQLSEDISEAAETRAIYLVGVYERTTSVVEKTTLAVEINGLWNLKVSALDWQLDNCREVNPG